ncbi:MAG: hypothetical protein L0Y58_11755 [Verrucomicrobia subdivision 3 bacterium]|nr:hypothetical protein [Limisphaerales bacterium]
MKSWSFAVLGGWGLVLIGLCGCKSKENSPEDAKLKDQIYTNRFFGFQMQIPKNWVILDKPSKRAVRKGAEAILGGDKETAAEVAEVARDCHFLLMARDLWTGTSIGVMAMEVDEEPDKQSIKEYLEMELDLMAGPGKPLQRVNEVAPVRLGSREFLRGDVAGNVMGDFHHQAMFVTIEKGHVLMIIAGAKAESEIEQVVAKVGMPLTRNESAPSGKVAPTIAAREITKTDVLPEPDWVKQIKLQGIGGTEAQRLAIINGKTFGKGDAGNIKTTIKTVVVRCISVGDQSARVMIDGVEGERELQLARK